MGNMGKQYDWKNLYTGIRKGDRVALGKSFSLIESRRKEDRDQARDLVDVCYRNHRSTKSLRVGITGSPGVGKSSVVEKLGIEAIERGFRVAVLAVDPSSSISGGSIMGDKTRMPQLSASPNAFIRPSAAGSTLGGVASTTREAILLCEAAGYDFIVVETVGVGQSETAVYHMTDLFLFLVLPGAGDELQGIKRGIVEMADIVVINKSDGDRKELAGKSLKDYRNALHMLQKKESEWLPSVLRHSITDQNTTKSLLNNILEYNDFVINKSYKTQKRSQQDERWFEEMLFQTLVEMVKNSDNGYREKLSVIRGKIKNNELSPGKGVAHIVKNIKIDIIE